MSWRIYKPEDLVYSATVRCRQCGAGLAHPKNEELIGGAWKCATLLTQHVLRPDDHDPAYPFVSYAIMSEESPQAKGQTTRPQ